MRTVLLTLDEDGYWLAEVPSLPGCFTQGTTKAEVLENAKEAIAAYIKSLELDGIPIPDDVEVAMV